MAGYPPSKRQAAALGNAALECIAFRALLPPEREALAGELDLEPLPEGHADWAAWRQTVADGDEAVHAQRLADAGWDRQQARLLLGEVRGGRGTMPPWAVDFATVYRAAEWHWREPAGGEGLPFAPLLWPLVEAAAGLARAEGPPLPAPLEQALTRALARQLAECWGMSLYTEFSLLRTGRAAGLSGSDSLYRSFVQVRLDDALAGFLEEYPLCLRHAGTLLGRWRRHRGELARRLAADLPQLASRWGFVDPAELERAEVGLSDPHMGGRSVCRLDFPGGSLLYKPKPLAPERHFAELLDSLAALGCLAATPLPTVEVMDRGDYGWVRAVVASECPDHPAAAAFYRRSGALLAVAYLVGATDLHMENLIATAEGPVLIDTETLLHPPVAVAGAVDGAYGQVQDRLFADSVLRVGMLPWWDLGGGGRARDVSGLTGGRTPILAREQVWRHLNTDRMRPAYESRSVSGGPHLPTLGGKELDAAQHLLELIEGFETVCRAILYRREAVRELPALVAFRRQAFRYILRPTWIYGRLLAGLFSPRLARCPRRTFLHLEQLMRAVYLGDGSHHGRPLVLSEQRQLAALDIPVFLVRADSRALAAPGGTVQREFFTHGGYDYARQRIDTLSPAVIAEQVRFIRTAFQALENSSGHVQTAASSPEADNGQVATGNLLEAALAVYETLERTAFRGPDGSINWITAVYHDRLQRWQVQPMGQRLFDGLAGVALFYAQLMRVEPAPEIAARARNLAEGVARAAAQPAFSRQILRSGAGIGTGLGSVVYTLDRLGKALEQPDYRETARRLAQGLDPAAQLAENRLDLLGGAAGAVLTLARMPGSGWPDRLRAAGRAVAEALDGPMGEVLPAGFAHGRSGVLYALVHVLQRTGPDPRIEATLSRQLERLRREYREEEANWPDPRYRDRQGRALSTWTWCGGAPGILGGALTAAAAVNGNERPAWQTLARQVVEQERQVAGNEVDHLCCGNLGRAMFLADLGQRLGDPVLTGRGRRLGMRTVGAAGAEGYALGWEGGPVLPGLFQGLSGIGLGLLHLDRPERVANPLLFP